VAITGLQGESIRKVSLFEFHIFLVILGGNYQSTRGLPPPAPLMMMITANARSL
jgi:hypothetical protein